MQGGTLSAYLWATRWVAAGLPNEGSETLIGIQDRGANMVCAVVVEAADREALKAFVVEKTTEAASVFGDDAAATQELPRRGFSVKQAVGEIGRDQA